MRKIATYCVILSVFVITAGQALAVNTTYYVDSVNGSDSNNGTSPATAWKTLTKVNNTTFGQGDNILFKAGCSWTGTTQLYPKGSGVSGNPIRIDTYGAGPKPIINAGLATGNGTVYLYNQSYWEINNLEITSNSATEGDRRGVQIRASNSGTWNHIYLKNLYIHNIAGIIDSTEEAKRTGGINIRSTHTSARFNDILIENCVISSCDGSGISTETYGSVYPGTSTWDSRKFTNLIIRGNTINDISKNAMIIRMTDETCLIEHNLCYDTAFRAGSGNTIFSRSSRGTIFQFNEGYLNRAYNPDGTDGSLYDADIDSPQCVFQYSYSHENNEGLFWYMEENGTEDSNVIVRYNISRNDKGALIRLTSSSGDAKIYNNVFYIPANLSPRIIWESTSTVLPARTYSYYNNIFYNLSPNATYTFSDGGHYNRIFSHNVFYGFHPANEPSDSDKFTSDPMFVNPDSGGIGLDSVDGYMLRPYSPCIDTGMTVAGNGGQDYWGNPVPVNGAADRGANEYITGDVATDGIVDLDDVLVLLEQWLNDCSAQDGWCGGCDVDKNSIVDFIDFSMLSQNWLFGL